MVKFTYISFLLSFLYYVIFIFIYLFIYYEGLRATLHRILTMWIKSKTLCIKLNPWTFPLFVKQGTVHN